MGIVELVIVKGDVEDCIRVINEAKLSGVKADLPPRPVGASPATGAPYDMSTPQEPVVVETPKPLDAIKEAAGVAPDKPKRKRKPRKKKEDVETPQPMAQPDPEPVVASTPEPAPEPIAATTAEPQPEPSGEMTEAQFLDIMREMYIKYKDKHSGTGYGGTKLVNKAMMTVIKEEGGYNALTEVPPDKFQDVIKKCTYVLDQL